jgi:hypothetical protein
MLPVLGIFNGTFYGVDINPLDCVRIRLIRGFLFSSSTVATYYEYCRHVADIIKPLPFLANPVH